MTRTRLITLLSVLYGLAFAYAFEAKTVSKPETCEQKTKAGDHLSMHYTGRISETSATGVKGKQFDSSVGRSPFDFQLGAGQVIKGWDQGLMGMCVGEKRQLILPPEFGYGDRGAGADIPAGATLEFDVELLGISEGKPQPNIFAEIDANKNGEITKEELAAWFLDSRQLDKIPDGLWENEDKDKDGKISWAEFGGPKGEAPPNEEL